MKADLARGFREGNLNEVRDFLERRSDLLWLAFEATLYRPDDALKSQLTACLKVHAQFLKHLSSILPGRKRHGQLTDAFMNEVFRRDRLTPKSLPAPKMERVLELTHRVGSTGGDEHALYEISGPQSLKSATLQKKLIQWIKRGQFGLVEIALALANNPWVPDKRLMLLLYVFVVAPSFGYPEFTQLSDKELAEEANRIFGRTCETEEAIRKLRVRYGFGHRTKNGKAVRD